MSSGNLSLKLIIVGSTHVGKTSLVSAFFEQQFETQTVSTVAPAFSSAKVNLPNETTVELQIWDTAGQEQYQSISQMFYRDAQIAFVCYDKENYESIEQWIVHVHDHVPECLIILVATKTDLLSTDQLAEERSKGKEFQYKYGCAGFYTTSAKSGQGVQELFHGAAQYGEQFNTPKSPTIDKLDSAKNKNERGCC